MKSKTIKIIVSVAVVLMVAVLCVLTFVNLDNCKKETRYYSIDYTSTAGGKLLGKTRQVIEEGKDGETVTASPDAGYRFLRWDDTSNPNPQRTDLNVTKNKTPQAKFVKISEVKYKILLVYVTEVQATLKDCDGNDIVTDYKMTEEDLALCHMITQLFDVCLNELVDGLVTFEVDEYYTKEVVREENITYVNSGDGNFDGSLTKIKAAIFAENIPEVTDKMKDYRSCITTFPLSYESMVVNNFFDSLTDKSASIVYQLTLSNINQEALPNTIGKLINDYSEYGWLCVIESYVRLFIDTLLKQQIDIEFPYSDVFLEYIRAYDKNPPTPDPGLLRYYYVLHKLCLLNQLEHYNKTFGVPFEVYTNEIYKVEYIVNDESMGEIMDIHKREVINSPFKVAKGYNCPIEVWAVPHEGYKFVRWSDGVTTSYRQEENIQSDKELIAYFEPINP